MAAIPQIDVPAHVTLPSSRRRGVHVPQWLRLLLGNPKSRGGIIVLSLIVAAALAAPLIARHDPSEMSLLDAGQAPSWHHFFGTTDQGTDIFAQVVWGARTSLLLGLGAAVVATVLATTLGILAADSGGVVDDAITFLASVFLVIPTIPLLV